MVVMGRGSIGVRVAIAAAGWNMACSAGSLISPTLQQEAFALSAVGLAVGLFGLALTVSATTWKRT